MGLKMNYLKPGSILNNGAIAINHNPASGKILAVVPGGVEPYVIWNIRENGDVYQGSYYKSILKATFEFGYLV